MYKKNERKFVSLFLLFSVIFSLCACGNKELKPTIEDQLNPELNLNSSNTSGIQTTGSSSVVSTGESEIERLENGSHDTDNPFVFTINNDSTKTYALPMPVSDLLSDGWKIVDDGVGKLASGLYTSRTLFEKDGKTLITRLYNSGNETTFYDNCEVVAVSMESVDDAALTFGFFTYGSDYNTLVATYGEPIANNDGVVYYLFDENKKLEVTFNDGICCGINFMWF